MHIREWVDERLKGTGRSPINALTAAFQIAILRVLSLRMTQRVHEEPLTGFLLGAFASLAPVCSLAFEDEEDDRCSWQYFPKSGSGHLTEPATGADFALIVEKPGKLARLAIFQAKRENLSPADTFKIHQVREPDPPVKGAQASAPRPTQRPQFLRLLRHAQIIARRVKAASGLADLHWTHYLIYSPKTLRCVSIDQFGSVRRFYVKNEHDGRYPDPGSIDLQKCRVQNLFWLLTQGADPNCKGIDLKGWLEIPDGELEGVRESLISFTDVFVGHHGPRPNFDNDPSSGQPSSPEAIVAAALEKFLREDDAPAAYRSSPDHLSGKPQSATSRSPRNKK